VTSLSVTSMNNLVLINNPSKHLKMSIVLEQIIQFKGHRQIYSVMAIVCLLLKTITCRNVLQSLAFKYPVHLHFILRECCKGAYVTGAENTD